MGKHLSCILSTGNLALTCLAVEVGGSRVLDGSLVLRQVGRLEEGLVDKLILAEKAANGLIVSKLG